MLPLLVLNAYTQEPTFSETYTLFTEGKLNLTGNWALLKTGTPRNIDKGINQAISIRKEQSKAYFVHLPSLPLNNEKISYGSSLNFKYFSGLSYEYLRKLLPGKTISVDVFIPESSISPDKVKPNRLRVTIKSEKDGEWTEYYEGSEWIKAKDAGIYTVKLKIPDAPVKRKDGKIFHPDRTILFSIEYYLMEGPKYHKNLSFSFFNFAVEGIPLDQEKIKWQFQKNGYVIPSVFVPEFTEGSTYLNSLGRGLELEYKSSAIPDDIKKTKDISLMLSAYLPKELRTARGTISLLVDNEKGLSKEVTKPFASCNLDGRTFLTTPLDPFFTEENMKKIENNISIHLKFTLDRTDQTIDTPMPVVIEPVVIKQGQLIPFDKKWQVRDPQGCGGYKKLGFGRFGNIEKNGIIVSGNEKDSYEMLVKGRLRGGIDWKNPYYRFELVRDIDNWPLDLDNAHIELVINPMTSTQDVWQIPYRARIGIIDANGNIMFGPNISLSEDMTSIATLDVSTVNPIPKGWTMPGFDPKKVRSVLINVEASHAPSEIRDVKISFANFLISPRKPVPYREPNKIDFSCFNRNPSEWEINKLVNMSGGYLVGMNYPFPVVDVSKDILEVPQVYPVVGYKPNDPLHLGFSSELTKKAAIRDFTYFATNDISLMRLFTMGHLEGVFTWDERGKDITGFLDDNEAMLRKMSQMKVEALASFLNTNNELIFKTDAFGRPQGFEPKVIDDFKAIIDILRDVEEYTGKRLMAILSLVDFTLGDGVITEGPLRKYNVGEHSEIITDPMTKVKAEALIWKLMKSLSAYPGFYDYIAAIEVMNEPDNGTNLATREHFTDLVNFVGENVYLVKDAVGEKMPVTVGFRSWPEDLRYWQGLGEGIDLLIPHYWESFESYCIDRPGYWSLDMPAKSLWDYIGSTPDGRLTGLGEISPNGGITRNLYRIEKAGYDLILIWSYSGHDGHNAKPVMDKICAYQRGNMLMARLKNIPFGLLDDSLNYILNSMVISRDLKRSNNYDLKEAMTYIMAVLKLKSVPVSDEAVKFLASKIRPATFSSARSRKEYRPLSA